MIIYFPFGTSTVAPFTNSLIPAVVILFELVPVKILIPVSLPPPEISTPLIFPQVTLPSQSTVKALVRALVP